MTNDEPHLEIDWTGATDADRAKALAGINAAFTAIGTTAAQGALAAFAREADELHYMAADDPEALKSTFTAAQHQAADLLDTMEEIALMALGRDVTVERLPGFDWRIDLGPARRASAGSAKRPP